MSRLPWHSLRTAITTWWWAWHETAVRPEPQPWLIKSLEDLFPDSLHVRLIDLAEADDLTIRNHAKVHGLVIVTQDSDYPDWNKFLGAPPKIVWLRCGNASVDAVEGKLRNAAGRILLMETQSDIEVVEVW